jgi:FkbM family methyltransferase
LRNLLRAPIARLPGDIAMELDPEEWGQIDLRQAGVLEPQTTALFDRLLRPGDTAVDVGAHVGYHTLRARRRIGETGRVFAIDPQPYNCHKLLTNAELNGFANIIVIAAAIGASSSFAPLKQQSRTDRSRLTLRGAGVNDGAGTFIAPVVTLDWLFATQSIDRAALLKIDVEGYELEVLTGAAAILDRVDNIVLEILPGEEPARVREIEKRLRAAGFRLCDVTGDEWRPGTPTVENNVWGSRS